MKAYKILKNSTISLCMVLFSVQLYGQVTGKGEPVKQERNVPAFTSLEVRSGIDVFITQGSKQSVVIQAEENLQDLIITEVSGSTLQVYVKKGTSIWKSDGMDAFITVTDLRSVSVSGGGDVESQSLIKSTDLELGISGGGDLTFNLESGRTSCSISGGGDANISGAAGVCRLAVSGGGDLEMKAGFKSLDAAVSGGGDVSITTNEKSDEVRIAVSGGGDLDMNVNTSNLSTAVTGGGDAEISAGTNMGSSEVTVSGGGDLQMSLEAEDLKISVSGGGDANLKGALHNLEASISSGSDLNADGCNTVNAKINLTGGSGARLNVTGNLDLSASGGGQVYLTGKPEMKNISLSGGSELHNE